MAKSRTAWYGQPQASKRLIELVPFPEIHGGKAVALMLDIRDKCAYYAEHPTLEGGYGTDWDSTWGERNIYMPDKIHNAEQAIKAVQNFSFPDEIRGQARTASHYLVNAFEDVAKMVISHDQLEGRFDRRKMAPVMRSLALKSYQVEKQRPFRKVFSTPAKKPTIAIVAEAANSHMWSDETYIPRMLILTLGVLWACQAVQLNAWAALVQQMIINSLEYKEALWVDLIARPNRTLPLTAYACIMQRDLWRYGRMTSRAADPEGHAFLNRLQGVTHSNASNIGNFGSSAGGNGVHWAREALGAEVVISIGKVSDRASADIILETNFEIIPAVQSIAEQAVKLRGKRKD